MTYSEPSFDENKASLIDEARALAASEKFNLDDWEFGLTLSGGVMMRRPGWEITRIAGIWQAIAISSTYRFCGQGSSPRYALEDAVKHMRQFREELDRHLAAI